MILKIRLFDSVLTVYLFSLLNFLFSLVLQLVLAMFFGARTEMDAYLVAMNIPAIVVSLILSFEAVFVPTFKRLSIQAQDGSLPVAINTLFNSLVLILSGISLVGLVFSPAITALLAPGFSPAQKDLVNLLFRIMVPYMFFSGLAAFITSIYHFREKFVIPALLPLVNTATIIIIAFLFKDRLGISGLAVGVLVGSIVQLAFLLPGFLAGGSYSFILDFKHSALSQAGNKLAWLTAGGISLGCILAFERYLASNLPVGSISALGYAGRMISIAVLLPSIALPTVLLPTLSGYYAKNDIEKMKELLSRGIRLTIICVLPLGGLLVLFRSALVSLLFQRGAFDALAANNTAEAIVYYMGLFLALGISKVITIGFLAIGNVFVPSLTMFAGFLVYFLSAPLLAAHFSFRGLALAFSLCGISAMALEVYLLRRRLGGIDGRRITIASVKALAASLVMCAGAYIIYNSLPVFSLINQVLAQALRLALACAAGIIIFNLAGFILRMTELRTLYDTIYLKLRLVIARRG
ncbi:MAG: lipid II flippase MurJ [Candidatus Omnitrophica bacterium]|nr:lipid II flippase MurJ [Candidatus Omnitrophota bacterium]